MISATQKKILLNKTTSDLDMRRLGASNRNIMHLRHDPVIFIHGF
jgi:hypothetical protein